MNSVISKIICVTVFIISFPAIADGDPRYCGIENIQRDQQNQIIRSQIEYWKFRSWWACPSTLAFKGACQGWSVDHPIPLAVGGCDTADHSAWPCWVTSHSLTILPSFLTSISAMTGPCCRRLCHIGSGGWVINSSSPS